jgi:hypothetical protein
MKFDILNRFTGSVQFTAEIDCADDASASLKIGLAVKCAVKARAYLADANLARAYLARANLAGAYLAGANLAGANLAGANLADAYLAGANLADANLADANLADANLAGAYLADTYLAGANLAGAYLADTYLAGANLADTYLAGANLADANLAGANLADAKGLDKTNSVEIKDEEVPIIPNIDVTILSAIENGGTLDMGLWHGDGGWCGTTHCRAGWAIHLAGEKGKALEDKVGSQMAAAMIYRASRPGKSAPWFFAPTDVAMADIKKCAAEQSKMTTGD